MSTGLKALGIVGAGSMLALGISASEPSTSVTNSKIPVAAPKMLEIEENIKREIKPASSCHPSYSACLKMNAGDYDCDSGSGNGPNYTGPVQVYGSDPFDLDRDSNGWGCEG